MKLSKVGRQLLLLLIGFNICGRIGVLGLPTFFDYPVNSSDTFPRIINSDNILPAELLAYHDSPPTASDIFVPFSGGPFRHGPGPYRPGPGSFRYGPDRPSIQDNIPRFIGGPGINIPPGVDLPLGVVPYAGPYRSGVNLPPGYITYEEWLKKNGREPSDKLHIVPFAGPGMLIPIDPDVILPVHPVPVPDSDKLGVDLPPGYITYEEWLKRNGRDPEPEGPKLVPLIGPFRSPEPPASLTGVPRPYPPELYPYGDKEVEPPVIDEEHQSYDNKDPVVEPPVIKEKYPSLGGYSDTEVEPPVIKEEHQSYASLTGVPRPYPPELFPYIDTEVEPPVIKEEHQSYDSLFDRIRPFPPKLVSLPGIPSHVFTNLMWTKIPKHLLPTSAEKVPGNYRGGSGLQIRTPGGRDPGSHLPTHDILSFRRQKEQSQPGFQNLYEKNWELATLFN